MNQEDLFNGIRTYAREHSHEDGWDFLVDGWSNTYIHNILVSNGYDLNTVTFEQALNELNKIVKTMNARRKEILAEVS